MCVCVSSEAEEAHVCKSPMSESVDGSLFRVHTRTRTRALTHLLESDEIRSIRTVGNDPQSLTDEWKSLVRVGRIAPHHLHAPNPHHTHDVMAKTRVACCARDRVRRRAQKGRSRWLAHVTDEWRAEENPLSADQREHEV